MPARELREAPSWLGPAGHDFLMRPGAAGALGCVAFLLIGWSGLLIPSLIRSIKETFLQSDAGIGLFYFVFAIAWAGGAFGGGLVVERFGRRTVLTLAATFVAIGLVGLGIAPTWEVFLLAGLPTALGAGAIDGGGNALILDLYESGRGRALNLLHVFFSMGALAAPVTIGWLVEGGVGWQAIIVGTGLAAVPLAILFGLVTMPSGRSRSRAAQGASDPVAPRPRPPRLAAPLILMAVAIACYVGSEVGVSNWLVRFLEPVPLSTATFALSLYWAGIAVGRILSSQLADRFDHLNFTVTCAAGLAIVLLGAILVPSLPVSLGLFALAGVLSGPIFPMIIAIGGERYRDRSAAVTGFLTGTAVTGSILYPPIMGLLSVTVGLTVAMIGNAVLALASAGALLLAGRRAQRR
jgi:fucose permease